MRFRKWFRRLLLGLAGILMIISWVVGMAWWYYHPAFTHTHAVVYGQRNGRDLLFEVLKPRSPKGLGVILVVSGGWKSGTNSIHPWMLAPLLRHGYTVFPVCHVSPPFSTVTEMAADLHHAVRFVRYHAADYGIDPKRLGVTGGSAGGHLGLVLATLGGPGSPAAPDPVDRESSAIQAAAVFYPVTDLLNLHGSITDTGGILPPKGYEVAFGSVTNREIWQAMGRDLSPIYHITTNLPPTLIYHGDADTLVPLEQSEHFQQRAHQLQRTVELVVHPGGSHGWISMVWDIRQFALWFDRYLAPTAQKKGTSDLIN